MTFETFSPSEVRFRYERAKNKRQIIRVLADLTCSTEAEMADFLGVELPSSGKINSRKAYKLYKEKMSDLQMAKVLGVSRMAVYDWRIARGLPQLAALPGQEARLEAYRKGLSDAQAARELGMSRRAFGAWRNKQGLSPNGRKMKHE